MPKRFRERHVSHRQTSLTVCACAPWVLDWICSGSASMVRELPVEIGLSPVEGDGRIFSRSCDSRRHRPQETEAELIEARQTAETAREASDESRRAADAARESADRANQAKSRFLATASHDLRQPLQSLSLLNGALRRASLEPEVQRGRGSTRAGHRRDVASSKYAP